MNTNVKGTGVLSLIRLSVLQLTPLIAGVAEGNGSAHTVAARRRRPARRARPGQRRRRARALTHTHSPESSPSDGYPAAACAARHCWHCRARRPALLRSTGLGTGRQSAAPLSDEHASRDVLAGRSMGHQTSRRLLREGHMLPREPIARSSLSFFPGELLLEQKKTRCASLLCRSLRLISLRISC